MVKDNLLRASLCDSRSCNQQGGGEHMKADIEDVVQLVPKADGRKVQLTTCMGLCNRSPNIKLQSRGAILLYPLQHGRLVNDGGFRMRLLDDDDDNKYDDDNERTNDLEETTAGGTHKAIISEMSIRKVARVLGILEQHPHAVRAIEYKAAGNKCLRTGSYEEALRHYSLGQSELLVDERACNKEEDEHVQKSIWSLAASLWLCRVKCRVQWATSTPEQHPSRLLSKQEVKETLRLAAGDALQVLALNTNVIHRDGTHASKLMNGSKEAPHTAIHSAIANLLQTDAATETKMSAADARGDGDSGIPVNVDLTILAHLCVALADAWNALAEEEENSVAFRKGALVAFKAVLAAATVDCKVFRIRERRRITQLIEALEA